MQRAMQKYKVILLMIALFTICLLGQLNAQAYYAVPMYNYSNRMLSPFYNSLSSKSLGNSINGLLSIFPLLPVAGNIYSAGGLFPGFDTASTNAGIGKNIQANPGANVQNSAGDSQGLSIYPYGLANILNTPVTSGLPYSGLNYLPMGLPITGLLLANLSGTGMSGMGFPGIGFPGIQPLGIGVPGTGLPWMWNSSSQFIGGEEGSDNQDILSQQPNDLSNNYGSPLLNPLGNLLSRFFVGTLSNPLNSLISPLSIIPPFDSSLQLANLNTKMYVAASIEGISQTIYILLLDDGTDSDLSLKDILVKGIHCIKAKDVSNAEVSIKNGKDNYNISLYLEINSGSPIWAWNEKWWEK